MADTPKTLAELETPIADALMMAEIVVDLAERATEAATPVVFGGVYHAITVDQATRILWAATDAVSRMKRLRADWESIVRSQQ